MDVPNNRATYRAVDTLRTSVRYFAEQSFRQLDLVRRPEIDGTPQRPYLLASVYYLRKGV